jgi:hypothetical protein
VQYLIAPGKQGPHCPVPSRFFFLLLPILLGRLGSICANFRFRDRSRLNPDHGDLYTQRRDDDIVCGKAKGSACFICPVEPGSSRQSVKGSNGFSKAMHSEVVFACVVRAQASWQNACFRAFTCAATTVALAPAHLSRPQSHPWFQSRAPFSSCPSLASPHRALVPARERLCAAHSIPARSRLMCALSPAASPRLGPAVGNLVRRCSLIHDRHSNTATEHRPSDFARRRQ